MKRNLLVIFFTLTFTGNLYSQNPLVKHWDYRFGGIADETLSSFQQTRDGGYILEGFSNSIISGDKTQNVWGNYDYWIVKIDSLGNKQWDKNFGGTGGDFLYSSEQTTDGGFVLGGYSFSGISGDKTQNTWGTIDFWAVKIDSLGNKQWDKDFGGTDHEQLLSLQQTNDGGYILGGVSNSGISGDKTQNTIGGWDYWIVKTDSLGNKQWDKDFGGTGDDFLCSLEQTNDGGFILGGFSLSGISGDKTQNTWGADDFWIVKIDSLGNKQWDKDFGGTGYEELFSLKQTADGGIILGGYSNSGISGDKTQNTWGGSYDFWIVKIDSLGNKQWDKDFGGTLDEDAFGNIFQTPDGGYLLSGTSYSPISGDKTESNLGHEQTWIVKVDSAGNKQWDKTLHTDTGLNDDEIGFAIQSNDGCYVMANCTKAGTGGDKTQPNWDTICIGGCAFDYWIIKFCDTTSTTSINQISNSQCSFSIYPNPTNTILNLVLSNKVNIVLTNLVGEIVLQEKAKGKIELDVSSLSPGIYFIKVGNEVRKFVKE